MCVAVYEPLSNVTGMFGLPPLSSIHFADLPWPPRLELNASPEKMKIYPGVTALNFISGALLLLYLPLQIRTRNIGLSFFILWVSALCFAYGANTVVWRDNALNSSPVWCEICMFAFPPFPFGMYPCM